PAKGPSKAVDLSGVEDECEGMRKHERKLPGQDSNLDKENQNLVDQQGLIRSNQLRKQDLGNQNRYRRSRFTESLHGPVEKGSVGRREPCPCSKTQGAPIDYGVQP